MAGFATAAALLLPAASAWAPAIASWSVTASPTAPDGVAADGQCSLREAIDKINGNTATDCDAHSTSVPGAIAQLILPAGTYSLTQSGVDDTNAKGDLDITHNVNISGAGAPTTTIDGTNGGDRVIDIHNNVSVSVSDVTITGGHAPNAPNDSSQPGGNGGGINNSGTGTLALQRVVITHNIAGNGALGVSTSAGFGGNGGGVYSAGPLSLDTTTVSNNAAGNGGALNAGAPAGLGGFGGGIFATDPSLTITNSHITNNSAGTGGQGETFPNPAGNGGFGGGAGGIYAKTLTMSGSTVSGNTAGDGGPSGNASASNSTVGGSGGSGGGILLLDGANTITNSTISGNTSGSGGAGGGAPSGMTTGTGGVGGAGGGIWVSNGSSGTASLTLTGSTVSGNTTGAGGASTNGQGGNGGNGGGIDEYENTLTIDSSTISGNATGNGGTGPTPGFGGFGGGLHVGTNGQPSTLALTNSTLQGNKTGNGGNNPGSGGGGAGGYGGGVYNLGAGMITNSTIAANTTGTGGTGGADGARNTGGGIMIGGGSTTLENTIVSGNQPAQCKGTVSDGGHNLSFPDKSCPGTNSDPLLGALADNGGSTQTMALDPKSPAVDSVPAVGANCPATDQRGTARPQGAACDAGAFELVPPAPVVPVNPVPPGTDLTAPFIKFALTKQKLRKALRNGYVCFFLDNELGRASAQLFASGRDARGLAVAQRKSVAAGQMTVTKVGKEKLVLKFTNKAKRVFAGRKKVTLTLILTATDQAGNAAQRIAKVVLKR